MYQGVKSKEELTGLQMVHERVDKMDMITKIKEGYPSLTRKQKMIADYMLQNIEKMSFLTLRELSEELDVTEVTILNACSALGFNSFNEVKYESRKYTSLMEKVKLHRDMEYVSAYIPRYELQNQKELLKNIVKEEERQMESFLRLLDVDVIFEAAELFLQYDKIVLCGRGVSKLAADFLSIRLAGVNIASTVMDTELNDSLHAALPMFDEKTLVVAVSFPDYYFMTDKIAEYARGEGCKVLGITDSINAPITKFTHRDLLSPSATRLFLNTVSMPMALINILTSALDIIISYRQEDRQDDSKRFDSLFQEGKLSDIHKETEQ